jgi:hypothetical protein
MNEKHEEARRSIAQTYLNDFFEGLYLTGEPQGERRYHSKAIASAGKRYLQVIGVNEFPSTYSNQKIESHIEGFMSHRYQPEEPSGASDSSSLVLGLVVGTAVFHPDSQLRGEQKDLLVSQTVDALRRVNEVEGDDYKDIYRGNVKHFVEVFTGCAREYHPDFEIQGLRKRLYERCDGADDRGEDRQSVFRRIVRRLGKGMLDGAQHYPGAILPNFRANNPDDPQERQTE